MFKQKIQRRQQMIGYWDGSRKPDTIYWKQSNSQLFIQGTDIESIKSQREEQTNEKATTY